VDLDFITIGDELERQEKLKLIGNHFTIQELVSAELHADNIIDYGMIVHQKKMFRELIQLAGDLAADAYACDPEAISKAEATLCRVAQGKTEDRMKLIDDLLDEHMAKIDAMTDDKDGRYTGIPTGFRDIDRLLG